MTTKTKEIFGVTFAWAETGTEGFIWSVQDEQHITHEGVGGWSYDGLNPLKTGDFLEVYDESGKVIFSKVINLIPARIFPYPTKSGHVLSAYCHNRQKGTNIEKWSKLFITKHKCKLIKKS